MSAAAFKRQLKALEKDVDKRAAEGQQEFTRLLVLGEGKLGPRGGVRRITGLLQRTPVRSGHARGNWRVARSANARAEVFGQDYSGPAGAPPSGEERARIMAQTVVTRPYGRLYVVNGAPYIGPLNAGHSEQAPTGWIDAVGASAEAVTR